MINKALIKNKNRIGKDAKLAFWLLLPALGYILCVMVFPFIWALLTSLTDKTIGSAGNFVGLRNYIDLILDKRFLESLTKTMIYLIACLTFKTVFGVSMALILNKKMPARSLFRSLLVLPWTLPTVVSVLTWKWLFSDIGGAFNFILQKLGIIETMIPWLSNKSWAMVSVVLVDVWRGAPFILLSALAGLQTIPVDWYEAADIDGANAFRKFRHITLPSIMNVLTIAMLVSTVWTINGFELIWLLTGGGPGSATETFAVYSYVAGFRNNRIAKSISISVLVMPIVIFLVEKITKRNLEDK